MKVFKFGGASIESVERIRLVGTILQEVSDNPLVVVISAMGKTTNDLEKVVENYFLRKREIAAQLLNNILEVHMERAAQLLETQDHPVFEQIRNLLAPIEWLLGEKPYLSFDYYYDQVVSLGELLSSSILHAYLNHAGLPACWLDVRQVIRTDDNYRDGRIDWGGTTQNMLSLVRPLLDQFPRVITQGFIGATAEKAITTLGREGSDYSSAVFAHILDAESLTIWKDVEGIRNADPKFFDNTVPIESLSYHEAIEMAYYGAQVIHPKTIKPLQNKKIPLFVRCFLDPGMPGTLISEQVENRSLPPIIVLKRDQVLITMTARDFSFVTEEKISELYELFHALRIRINLMQNGAISFSACVDRNPEKIEQLIQALNPNYTLAYFEGLQLLTVRHYEAVLIEGLTRGKDILMEQRYSQTVQIVMR